MFYKLVTMRDLSLSLGCILLIFNLLSAQKQEIDTTKTEQLKEVVVTAQYTPQSEKNAIYKVNVVNSKTIQAKAANNLRELLQQELNFELSQNSVFGTSIELQGISKENIKILIDGVPVIGRLNGIIDLNQISLSNIERVEIIEGPVSVFYGTDAMGGVINLITKKEQQKTLEGNASSYYEDINALNINGKIGYKFNKNTLQINGGYYHFDGLSTNDAPRNLNWEERNQHFGNVMYHRELGSLNLIFNSNVNNEKLISIGEPDRRGNILDKDYYTRRIDNYLNLKGKVLGNKFVDLTVSYLDYQRYHNTFDVDPLASKRIRAKSDNRDDNIVKFNYGGVKAQLGKNKLSDKINYAIGTDINVESTEGARIRNNKQSITSTIFYSSVNYKLVRNFEIQPAVRYTYNSSYGSLLSPALNTKLKIDEHNKIRFSYARGFRAPSLKELFLDFRISAGPVTYIISGNENLEVEKSHSFNLQYTFHKTFHTAGSLAIEPSVFYNDINNLIALSELENFNRNYININKFKSLGGKIDVTYHPVEAFSIKTGFSIIGRFNQFNENFDTNKYLYSPEFATNINYQLKKQQVDFTVYYKFSGKREGFFIDNTDDSLVKTTRASFNNLNATVSFLKKNLRASIGVKNAFDVTDIETVNEAGQAHARDMQLWGRSFFIKTTLNF